jgi:WD40 repeat protein
LIVAILSVLLLFPSGQVPAGRIDLESPLKNTSNGAVGTYFSWVFSPNGKWIAGGSSPVNVTDNSGKTKYPAGVFVWDAQTGKFLKRLGDHDESVDFLAFSANSQRLISGHIGRAQSKDPEPTVIQVWDLRRSKLKSKFGIDGTAKRPRMTADGKSFVWLGQDESLSVWNLDKGKQLWQLKDTGLKHFDISPDGKQIVGNFFQYKKIEVSGKPRRQIVARGFKAWNLSDGKELWQVDSDDRHLLGMQVFFHPQGKKFFAVAGGSSKKPGTLVSFDASDGAVEEQMTLKDLDSIGTVGISADGSRIAIKAFMGKTLTAWSLDDGKQLLHLTATFPNDFGNVAFSSDLDHVGGDVPGTKKDRFDVIGPGILPLRP